MVMAKVEVLIKKVEKMEEADVLKQFTTDSVNDCREDLLKKINAQQQRMEDEMKNLVTTHLEKDNLIGP